MSREGGGVSLDVLVHLVIGDVSQEGQTRESAPRRRCPCRNHGPCEQHFFQGSAQALPQRVVAHFRGTRRRYGLKREKIE